MRKFSMKLVKAFVCLISLAIWILGIVYASLVSNPDRKFPLYGATDENTLHMVAFFFLFIFFYVAISLLSNKLLPRLAWAAIFTAGVSGVKELLQIPRLTRDFSFGDIGADGIGVLCAIAVTAGLYFIKRRKKRLGLT